MQSTDLAISSGGTIVYELAYFGITSEVICQITHQIDTATEFSRLGIHIHTGLQNNNRDYKEVMNHIELIIDDSNIYNEMSTRGQQTIDGEAWKA